MNARTRANSAIGCSNPGRRPPVVPAALWLLLLFAVSPTAGAVDVQSLIGELCQYHVLDSDVCSAKAVVDCLVQSGGSMSGMQHCATQQEPEAQKFIAIYGAATKPDYVRLIELAGPIVACKLLPPGPPADILCSTAVRPIVSQAFGKAAKIYGAASKGDWLTVIYVIGDPAVACAVVPSFPGKDITCGALAQTFVAGAKLLKQGAEAGIKALESGVQTLGNAALGGLESLGLGGAGVAPVEVFDRNFVRPLLHQRALQGVTSSGKPFLGLDQKAVKACISYIPVGINKAPSDFDIKSCKQKSQQLHDQATALANLVRVAPAAYFENVNASASLLLATNFWSGKADQFIQAMPKLPTSSWSAAGFKSLPSPFSAVVGNCYENTRAAFPVPLAPQLTGPLTPPSLWGWVCAGAGTRLAWAMSAEKKRVNEQVMPLLTGAGCVVARAGDPSLRFDCSNGEALSMCYALLPEANPKSRCRRGANFQAASGVVVRMSGQPPAGRLSGRVVSGLVARPVTIEAEVLLQSNAVRVAGGRADVQPMAGFGTGWSGDEQIFWSGAAPGASLELAFDVPAAGRYAIELRLTRAPDYGRLRFELDGEPAGEGFDGYDAAVAPSGAVPLGSFTLTAGPHRLRVTIAGRNRQSKGDFAGLDSLRLVPAVEPQ